MIMKFPITGMCLYFAAFNTGRLRLEMDLMDNCELLDSKHFICFTGGVPTIERPLRGKFN